MLSFKRLTLIFPLSFTVVLVLLGVVISQLGAVLLTQVFPDITRETFAVFTRYATALLMILLLWKLDALRASGISKPKSEWGSKWVLAILPMVLIACLNLSGVEWERLVFSVAKVPFWFFENLATGVFEEILMRAMAFYILYRAWQKQSNGLLKAAIAQALIFGLLHLLNLLNGFTVDVLAQVFYAALLGISFAGIVAYTGSIWPAAFVHGLINAIANINRTFVPDYIETPTSIEFYALFIVTAFFITTLPGIYMLKHSKQSQAYA
ncbi:CPBP family intramembrane glutamic endopeptidase [Glaciecola sp. 2405UD65-10]|uniref:CPBP family intramembrane glutamic endopeptidase n=1 Tax=Glaciecola sp. 2405UD65-10 TaxID=3397244 RepID=UPI003B59569C